MHHISGRGLGVFSWGEAPYPCCFREILVNLCYILSFCIRFTLEWNSVTETLKPETFKTWSWCSLPMKERRQRAGPSLLRGLCEPNRDCLFQNRVTAVFWSYLRWILLLLDNTSDVLTFLIKSHLNNCHFLLNIPSFLNWLSYDNNSGLFMPSVLFSECLSVCLSIRQCHFLTWAHLFHGPDKRGILVMALPFTS